MQFNTKIKTIPTKAVKFTSSQTYECQIGEKTRFTSIPARDGLFKIKAFNTSIGKVLTNYFLARQGDKLYLYLGDGEYYHRHWGATLDTVKMITSFGKIGDAVVDRVLAFLKTMCSDMDQLYNNSFINTYRRIAGLDDMEDDDDLEPTDDRAIVIGGGSAGNCGTSYEPACEEGANEFLRPLSYFASKKYILVKGYIQSGKTNFMISYATYFALQGKHSVIVLRNSNDDKSQLTNRITEFNRLLQNFLGALGGSFDVKVVDSDSVTAKTLCGKPKIFVVIGHHIPLANLNETFATDDKMDKNYVTFIDEADYMDNEKSEGVQYKEQIDILKDRALCTFAVSATVMDVILEEEIRGQNIIIMKRPKYYYGLSNFQKHVIPAGKYGTKKVDDMIELYPYMKTFLRHFALNKLKSQYHYCYRYKAWHPRDFLIRVTSTLDSNHRLLGYIAETYPKVVSMFYSGGGCVALHINDHVDPIELSDGRVSQYKTISYDDGTLVPGGKYHVFTKTSPAFIKEWLYNNGGFVKYRRIVTLADRMAARSISFGAANHAECRANGKIWWHLTGMLALMSDGTDLPELMQTFGRLCVVKQDEIPLLLYSTQKIIDSLVKSFWLQEELLERGMAMLKEPENEERTMAQVLKETPIYSEKIDKRSMFKKKNPTYVDEDGERQAFYFNRTSDELEDIEAGGYDMEEMYVDRDHDTDKILVPIKEKIELEEKESEEASEEPEASEIPEEEFKRLTTQMFPRWANADTKIGRFMQGLDPKKIYTESDMKKYNTSIHEKGLNMGHLMNNRDTSKHGSGSIIRRNKNGTYQLYPELRDCFNKYF